MARGTALRAAALAIVLTGCATAEPARVEVQGAQQDASSEDADAPGVSPSAVTVVTQAPPPPAEVPAATARPLGPEGQPGTRTISLELGGVVRQWTLVVPEGRSAAPAPLLIVLHGVGGRGQAMRSLGFDSLAASFGALVAYPDAFGGTWNDGRPGMEPLNGPLVDDIAFLRALIDETAARAGADVARVALVGFSNGAIMASRAACDLADRLSAVALVAGAGPRDLAARCQPARPVPLLVVFGTADGVVPYAGGQVAAYNGKNRGLAAGVDELLSIWMARDRCTNLSETALPGTSPAVTEVRALGCSRNVELVHYRVQGGGHEWPVFAGFDTTTRIWDFARRYLMAVA